MASDRRFLFGRGEVLARSVDLRSRGGPKKHPYSFEEARTQFVRQLRLAVSAIDALPGEACPADEAVVQLTVHPTYLAKSYFPETFFRTTGTRPVGSRQRTLTPRKTTRVDDPGEQVAMDLFVAAKRRVLRNLQEVIPQWAEDSVGAEDLRKFEEVVAPSVESKVMPAQTNKTAPLMEVVLHAGASRSDEYIVDAFERYLSGMNIDIDMSRRLYAGRLCFLPVRIPRRQLSKVALFSYLRVLREMPRLRSLDPDTKHHDDGAKSFSVNLPKGAPISGDFRVAVFDGGVPEISELSDWVNTYETPGVGKPSAKGLEHGLGVTSALLFGPLSPGEPIAPPAARIDHYRVLDETHFGTADSDLFEVLDRIVQTLGTKKYELINLSIGPDIPIEDNEVHAWTAKLDELLSEGSLLATVAVGNNGDLDHSSGNARVQPPSDAVNALSVGAADSLLPNWGRANYSAIGPGRSPGLVKPNLVAFGGSGTAASQYYVLNGHVKGGTRGAHGTSYAAPTVLRSAVHVRAHMGNQLTPLAIKALLVHRCEPCDLPMREVGWGRLAPSLDYMLTCAEDEALVVYQGTLDPAKWLRMPAPLPQKQFKGFVNITATFCFASVTDPQDPISYTRSGLEIRFRPHAKKFDKKAVEKAKADGKPHPQPVTKSFFGEDKEYASEHQRRDDAQKWETVLRGQRRMRGSSLFSPVFDVHYIPREGGGEPTHPRRIPYALIVTIRAEDAYNLVARAYQGVLEPLTPIIEIPIRP